MNYYQSPRVKNESEKSSSLENLYWSKTQGKNHHIALCSPFFLNINSKNQIYTTTEKPICFVFCLKPIQLVPRVPRKTRIMFAYQSHCFRMWSFIAVSSKTLISLTDKHRGKFIFNIVRKAADFFRYEDELVDNVQPNNQWKLFKLGREVHGKCLDAWSSTYAGYISTLGLRYRAVEHRIELSKAFIKLNIYLRLRK